MAYPVNCCCCVPVSVTVPACPSGNCLRVASLVVTPSNSTLPCGGAFSISIGAESDVTACTTGVNWYIINYNEDAFDNIVISSTGVVTGNTTSTISLNTPYTIVGKVTCDGSLLSQYFYITFFVKDVCFEIECSGTQECNPCDGTCQEPVDVELF